MTINETVEVAKYILGPVSGIPILMVLRKLFFQTKLNKYIQKTNYIDKHKETLNQSKCYLIEKNAIDLKYFQKKFKNKVTLTLVDYFQLAEYVGINKIDSNMIAKINLKKDNKSIKISAWTYAILYFFRFMSLSYFILYLYVIWIAKTLYFPWLYALLFIFFSLFCFNYSSNLAEAVKYIKKSLVGKTIFRDIYTTDHDYNRLLDKLQIDFDTYTEGDIKHSNTV
ncbi:hypothetical protein L3V86_02145 [Thiotrichales bacterium 19S11-10]|nr:hypothetical protein [Thiotrichales bacterium 19S11-10]